MRHFMGITLERTVWRNFRLEATNAVFGAMFQGVIGPFMAPLAVRLGASKLEMGILTAAPFLANLTAGIWSSFSQNGNPLRWVVVPHMLWRALLGLVGLIRAPWLLVSTSVVAHMAVTAAGPSYGRMMQKIYPPRERGRLMGFVRVLLAATQLVTVIVAGRLIDVYGPAVIFLSAGALGLVGISIFAAIRMPEGKEPPRPRMGMGEQLRTAGADPAFRRFLLAALLFHGGVLMAVPVYPQFQVQVLALSNTQISYLATSWTLAWLLSYAVLGFLSNRMNPRAIVMVAAASYLVMPMMYAVGSSMGLLMLGHLAQGVADAAMDLGAWAFILQTNPERVGSYTSAHMMLVGLRGALAPLIGTAVLGGFGMQPVFLLSAALVMVGWVLLYMARGQTVESSPSVLSG